jgi:hypothetical protein
VTGTIVAEQPTADPASGDSPPALEDEKSGSWRAGRIVSFVVFAAPYLLVSAVIDLYFTLRSTTNIVFADTWSFVPMLGKTLSGHFALGMLWDAHNENRQPFLRVLFMLSARFDHFNTTHLRIIGILVLLLEEAILLIGAFMLRRRLLRILVALGIVLLASSFGQWESMILEENSMFFLTVAGAASSFWLLEWALRTGIKGRDWVRLLPAVGCALVATLSLAGGLAVWPVLALRTVTYRRDRRCVEAGVAIGAFGLLETVLYAWNMPSGGLGQSTWAHEGPVELAKFFLLTLGNSIFNVGTNSLRFHVGYVIGAVALVGVAWSFGWNLWRDRSAWREPVYAVGLSLQLFGLLEVAFVEYGRIGMGIDLAFGSRYTTLTQTVPIGILLCLGSVADRSWVKSERRLMGRRRMLVARVGVVACVPLLAVGVLMTDQFQYTVIPGYHQNFVNLEHYLVSPQHVTNQQLNAFEWPPNDIRGAIPILREFHLSVYQH